jgi:hypothetical protein
MSLASDDRYGGATPTDWNQTIPQQQSSNVAMAMHHCRYKVPREVPIPFDFYKNAKRPPPEECKFKEPFASHQTWHNWEAFQEVHVAKNVQREDAIPALLEAEKHELRASRGLGPSDPNAAEPRQFAVTLLIQNVKHCVKPAAECALDAMAYFANANAPSNQHAARDARCTILTGECACMYARAHGKPMRNTIELRLAFANDNGELAQHAIELDPGKNNPRHMYYEIVCKLSALFEKSEMSQHRPASMGQSLDVTVELCQDAWVKALQWANDTFWNTLIVCTPLNNPGYKLDAYMAENMRFVKIYEKRFRATRDALVHPQMSWGVIACKDGQHAAALDFIEASLQGEKARRQANNTPTEIIGLPYPDVTDPAAMDLGLHVLEMHSDLVSFKGRVSCFNITGPLAGPVSLYPDSGAPRLVYSLQALHPKNYDQRVDAFLPVPHTTVLTSTEHMACTQLQALNLGFEQYSELFERGGASMPASPLGLKRFKNKPSQEDKCLSMVGGVPLGGYYRLGDVLSRLDDLDVAMPSFRDFLNSATRRLGPHASLSSAYADYAAIEKSGHRERSELQSEIHTLQCALEQATAPTHWDVAMNGIFLGMWRKKTKAYPMGKLPLAKAGLAAIKLAIALASGLDMQAAEQLCSDKRSITTDERDDYRKAILTLGAQLYPDAPFCLVVLDDASTTKVAEFLRAASGSWKSISSEAAIALSLQPSSYFVLYRTTKCQIVGMPRRPEPRPCS